MRTSLRLTPKAQRKKRLVIRMKGRTYFRSVSGADWGAKFPPYGLLKPKDGDVKSPLRQSAIEMDVAAVNENMLASNVAGLRRNEKQNHGGDFFGLRHALAEWNFGDDMLQFFLRIGKRAEPPLVKWRHDFGGDNGVDAHAVREQFASPVSREREDRAFGGSVTRSFALASHGDLRGDVDNAALRLFQRREGVMRHVVVMEQIELQRLDVFFRRAAFEADVIVDSHIVDQDIEAAEIAQRLLNDGGAGFGSDHVGDDEAAFRAGVGELFFELVGGFHVFIHKHGNGAFTCAAANDGRANSLPPSGDEDDLVFKLQVHVSPPSTDRSPPRCRRRFCP